MEYLQHDTWWGVQLKCIEENQRKQRAEMMDNKSINMYLCILASIYLPVFVQSVLLATQTIPPLYFMNHSLGYTLVLWSQINVKGKI